MDDYLTEEKIAELNEISKKYAEAKSERVYIEQFRKSKKSLLMREAEVAGCKSAVIQEREAYSHPDYIQLIDALKVATEKEEALRWRLTIEVNIFEQWRSRAATQRAEINLR